MSTRLRLLAVLDRNPFPPNDGVSYPIANHLRGLSPDWDIDLLLVRGSGAGEDEVVVPQDNGFAFGKVFEAVARPLGRSARLWGECLRGIPYGHHSPIAKSKLKELLVGQTYDALYAAPTSVVLWAKSIAEVLPSRPLMVLNLNDSLSEMYRRRFDLARMSSLGLRSRISYALSSARVGYAPRLERKTLEQFDLVFVQTPRDRDAVISDCGASMSDRLLVAPNGIKEELLQLPYLTAGGKNLVHIGPLALIRRDLLLWFVNEVFTNVREEVAEVKLHLAGSVTPSDRDFLGRIPGVVVHGFVENLNDILQLATMSVAPMFMRSGLVNKNLDSMAAGVPCSGIRAFNGVPGFENGVHGFELNNAEEWRRLLIDVLRDPKRLEKVSESGRRLVSENLRWHSTIAKINDRMQSMVRNHIETG